MRYFKKYFEKIYESTLSEVKKKLKNFQKDFDIEVSFKELMGTINAVEIDITSLFPMINVNGKIGDLVKNEEFMKELDELNLKISELYDSDKLETLSKYDLKWYWIYNEDSTDLDVPIYIILRYKKEKWGEIQMFMVQSDIDKFLDALSFITICFKHESGKRWFYTTSNSGENWNLDKNPKKIKEDGKEIQTKSEDETKTFMGRLNFERIISLSENPTLKTFVY